MKINIFCYDISCFKHDAHHYQFCEGIQFIRSKLSVSNLGSSSCDLNLSSHHFLGLENKPNHKTSLLIDIEL